MDNDSALRKYLIINTHANINDDSIKEYFWVYVKEYDESASYNLKFYYFDIIQSEDALSAHAELKMMNRRLHKLQEYEIIPIPYGLRNHVVWFVHNNFISSKNNLSVLETSKVMYRC